MNWNKVIFPAPQSSYTAQTFEGRLVWVPKGDSVKDGRLIEGNVPNPGKSRPVQRMLDNLRNIFKSKRHSNKDGPSNGRASDSSLSRPQIFPTATMTRTPSEMEIKHEEIKLELPKERFPRLGKNVCFKFFSHDKTRNKQLKELAFPMSPAQASQQNPPDMQIKKPKGFLPRLRRREPITMPEEEKAHSARPMGRRNKPVRSMGSSESESDVDSVAHIPCLLLQPGTKSTKLILLFHANSEDLSSVAGLCSLLRNHLMVNVMAVEYPGYGIYRGSCTAAKLLSDADNVWKFVTGPMKTRPEDVILLGRSIGSGPATYLASRNPAAALILVSAFTSVRSVAKNLFGSLAQIFVKERFDNLKMMQNVRSPVLLVHGSNDTLVPPSHATALRN
eukprot:TRINITY_DN2953_c0_g1_i3.p1 TRINITY_DN2953_c0_g1~~TRINITY_DN2953_c0_g1_i3.p1  ORF type:complete len:390 (+),score=31.41 TRINITY_DN2953_c0_g1_i3:174-1343(+)